MIFAISGHRKISEFDVANTYTYSQAMSLCVFLMKDRFLVVTELLKSFNSKSGSQKTSSNQSSVVGSKLPSWYIPRKNARLSVVDLDGPMSAIQPFLGKSRIRRNTVKK